jgi:hypothetical protein
VVVNKITEPTVAVTISIADRRIDLTTNPVGGDLHIGDTLTITAPQGFDFYNWSVDGVRSISSNNEIRLSISRLGIHSVLLEYGNDDGIPYGCETLFKVIR